MADLAGERSKKQSWLWGLPKLFGNNLAIGMIPLKEELQQHATTNELTGIFNRWRLLEFAPFEIKRTLRFKHPLSITIMDIDHFKNINDTYDHAMGVQIFLKFSKTCQKIIREIDVLAHFGGDEFVLFLPGGNRPCPASSEGSRAKLRYD